MIEALQINNNTFKIGQFVPSGLFADVYLVTPGYEDFLLKCTRISLSRGEDNSYSVFNFVVNDDDLDIILNREVTSNLTLKIYAQTPLGVKVLSHNLVLEITEFRYDKSPTANSVSFVSRTTINIGASADTTITPLVGFNRYDNPLRYVFGLNPEQYANYSIYTNVTYGAISGYISSFRLTFNSNQAHQLQVEVTPL